MQGAGDTAKSFLGVEASLSGRKWVGPTADIDRHASAMAQQTGLPGVLCNVLVRQGVTPETAESYLAPQLRDLLPDPRSLRDMEKAAQRFLQAIKNRERIAVFGDYDVDGGASSALLLDYLRSIGLRATLYIPDRIDEGYGPNAPAMASLAADHDLIICVDCGTLSHEALAAATAADATAPGALAQPHNGQADDLKKIKGVGPKLETILNTLGVFHFDQIMAWGPDDIAWMDENLNGFKGRVSRDDWVAQAKALTP